jgi:N-acetylmuramoyl-L-alanine amidase
MKKTESWQYAELLLMQAFNTQHRLVNPFFHTQIKRRIAMITSSQKPGHQYLRKLLVLPVAAIIAVLFAFSYKNERAKDDSTIKLNDPITIVVDAAHGGIDPGVKSRDGKHNEAQLALEISKTIQTLAKEYNIDVVMTREKDELPGGATTKEQGLKNRLAITKNAKPGAFISIHTNTSDRNAPGEKFSGIEAYMTDNKDEFGSKTFVTGILQNLSALYKTDLQIKQRSGKGIYVLDNNNYPAALLELGYMNNSKDMQFFSDKSNQEKVARAILNAVRQFANSKVEQESVLEKPKPVIDTPKIKRVEVTLVDTAPLVILDGKVYGKIDTRKIDSELSPYDIESISVLKGSESVKKYGETAKFGVVEVYTKGYIARHPEIKEERTASYEKYNKNNNLPLQEIVVVGYRKKESDDAIPIFEKVETPPSFPGGADAWRKYLEKNLNSLVPVDSGAKAGTYTVQVKFVVDKNGDVSSIRALTHHGFGMEEEVVRVIAKGPKWVPAKQNGREVAAFKTQPVTFVITEEAESQPIITDASKSKPSETDENRNKYIPKISISDLQKATIHDLLQYEKGIEISGFTFSMDNAGGTIDDSPNTGNEFNLKTRELIKNAIAGRLIAISEVTIIKDGVKKKVPARVYQVTN